MLPHLAVPSGPQGLLTGDWRGSGRHKIAKPRGLMVGDPCRRAACDRPRRMDQRPGEVCLGHPAGDLSWQRPMREARGSRHAAGCRTGAPCHARFSPCCSFPPVHRVKRARRPRRRRRSTGSPPRRRRRSAPRRPRQNRLRMPETGRPQTADESGSAFRARRPAERSGTAGDGPDRAARAKPRRPAGGRLRLLQLQQCL